jgi:hypothetical protein
MNYTLIGKKDDNECGGPQWHKSTIAKSRMGSTEKKHRRAPELFTGQSRGNKTHHPFGGSKHRALLSLTSWLHYYWQWYGKDCQLRDTDGAVKSNNAPWLLKRRSARSSPQHPSKPAWPGYRERNGIWRFGFGDDQTNQRRSLPKALVVSIELGSNFVSHTT